MTHLNPLNISNNSMDTAIVRLNFAKSLHWPMCVQRICVFVCPLIPNLNICPTSPNNIGPVARPCPLETAINSMLFLPILVLVHWPMTNKRKSKVGWDCENMEGEGLLIPDKSAQHPLPSMGSWEPKMLKYRCSKLMLNMGGKYDMYGIHSGISL